MASSSLISLSNSYYPLVPPYNISKQVLVITSAVELQILVYRLSSDIPELDLILLGKADYFIGNCISSFSAFVKRERDVNGKPSEFFALDQLKSDTHQKQKTEL